MCFRGQCQSNQSTSLQDLDIPVEFIHGNGYRVVRALMAGEEVSEVPEPYREHIRWVAEQLSPEHERLLASWPFTSRSKFPALGNVLVLPCDAAKRHRDFHPPHARGPPPANL